jgi:hypothetical protein
MRKGVYVILFFHQKNSIKLKIKYVDYQLLINQPPNKKPNE